MKRRDEGTVCRQRRDEQGGKSEQAGRATGDGEAGAFINTCKRRKAAEGRCGRTGRQEAGRKERQQERTGEGRKE